MLQITLLRKDSIYFFPSGGLKYATVFPPMVWLSPGQCLQTVGHSGTAGAAGAVLELRELSLFVFTLHNSQLELLLTLKLQRKRY